MAASQISKGALERSLSTNLSPRVSPIYQPTFDFSLSIPFRKPDWLKTGLQVEVVTLDPNKFADKNRQPLAIGSLQFFRRRASPTSISHRTQKPFYNSLCRQKNPASRENYASELYQVILRLSRVGQTSWEQMVSYGRVQF